MTGTPEPRGSLDLALAHAARLLHRTPALAAAQADEILRAAPGHPAASLLKGAALRESGDDAAAVALLGLLATPAGGASPPGAGRRGQPWRSRKAS